MSSLTVQQVDTIIEVADTLPEKCMVSLAFSSGLRLSELARIKIPDIDFETMTIRVVVKGNREARAVFDERTKELIKELIKELTGNRTGGSLFELKPRGIQDTMTRLSNESGIEFSCHSFRRAFASHLRRQGLDISHIMVLGNWQDLSMPLRYSESVRFEESVKLYRELG
jgi:integrase/recombinase XerD